MDLLSLVLIGTLAVAVGAAVAIAVGRGNQLERLREAIGAAPGAELETAVRTGLAARAEAEWQAARRAEEVSYLAELLGVGVVRLDDRLQVRLANEAAAVLLGRRGRGLVGLSAIEAFVDRRIEEVVNRARETGAATGELTSIEPGHEILFVRARRSPIEGIWLVIEDVSELRRLQRIRAEFIDNLSHELRTPLANVRLLTETLARDLERTDLPPRIRDGIVKIDVETGHLVQMVNELLDLSKIEQGTVPLHLDDVDLGTVVRGSVERLRLFADRQGVALEVDVPGDLPRVRGDDERLGQLLVNLLHNAVKFSSTGGLVTVRARLEEAAGPEGAGAGEGGSSGEIVVSVEDRGMGIPAADLGRIFERFYKVDRARVRGRGGTGLGLAIARHIVDSHGGRIWVESEEGRGATFLFAIPVAA